MCIKRDTIEVVRDLVYDLQFWRSSLRNWMLCKENAKSADGTCEGGEGGGGRLGPNYAQMHVSQSENMVPFSASS